MGSIYFVTNLYVHHDWEKYSKLWYSDKWKMNLLVKKLKIDISTTPRQNSLKGLYNHPQGIDKLLIPCS